MNINSKLIKIKKTTSVTSEQIEMALNKLGIIPLRWAIVKTEDDKLTISVAYENLC